MDGRRARALLGVSIDAGPDEIRRAFRMLALVNHPDRGGDRVEFELIVLAFESLQHVDVTSQLPWRGVTQLPVRPALPARAPHRRVRLAAPSFPTTVLRRRAPRRARSHDAVTPRAVGSDGWRPGSCQHARRYARPSRRTRTTPTRAASPSSPSCSRPTGRWRYAAKNRSRAAMRSAAFLEGVGVDLERGLDVGADDSPPRLEPDGRGRVRDASNGCLLLPRGHRARRRPLGPIPRPLRPRRNRRAMALRPSLCAHRRHHARRVGRRRGRAGDAGVVAPWSSTGCPPWPPRRGR